MVSEKHHRCRMPLAKAAAIWAGYYGVPSPGRPALQRWIRRGLRGVRLNAELFGGRYYARPVDFEAFHQSVNAAAQTDAGGDK